MKIEIDHQKCTGLGICESFAPSVFEVDEEGDLILLSEVVPDGLLDEVRRAVKGCPNLALTLRD
jgi:ferredoxin